MEKTVCKCRSIRLPQVKQDSRQRRRRRRRNNASRAKRTQPDAGIAPSLVITALRSQRASWEITFGCFAASLPVPARRKPQHPSLTFLARLSSSDLPRLPFSASPTTFFCLALCRHPPPDIPSHHAIPLPQPAPRGLPRPNTKHLRVCNIHERPQLGLKAEHNLRPRLRSWWTRQHKPQTRRTAT